MRHVLIFLLIWPIFSCKGRSASATKNGEPSAANLQTIPTQVLASKSGVIVEEVSEKYTVSGTAEKDGWIQILAEDGLNFVYKFKKGQTSLEIASSLKSQIDPGPFDLGIEEDNSVIAIEVLGDTALLQTKRAATEEFVIWALKPGEQRGLEVVAQSHQPAPKFNRATAYTWVIRDGRPQPPIAYLLEDGDTLFVAVPGITGQTWLKGKLSDGISL
ncbi:MAG: hypothetical protein AB7T49_04240 [Oligoflexales bacterium]